MFILDLDTQNKDVLTKEFVFGNNEFEFLQFAVKSPVIQNEKKPFVLFCTDKAQYSVEVGDSANGNMRRIINFLKSFDKTAGKLKARYDELLLRQSELLKEPYKAERYIEQILACEKEIEQIKIQLLPQE